MTSDLKTLFCHKNYLLFLVLRPRKWQIASYTCNSIFQNQKCSFHTIPHISLFQYHYFFFSGTAPIEIQAHKYMLVSASPVFYAMFCGGFKQEENIRIDDIDANAFHDMLRSGILVLKS